MCGNCAFGRSVDFRYRVPAYQMFGNIDSKKLTAFHPKTICLLCTSISKGRAAYRNALYRCSILTEITVWVLLSQPITVNTKQFYFKAIVWTLHTVLIGPKSPHFVSNEVSCGFRQVSKQIYLWNSVIPVYICMCVCVCGCVCMQMQILLRRFSLLHSIQELFMETLKHKTIVDFFVRIWNFKLRHSDLWCFENNIQRAVSWLRRG
jgi:hypothetical protein